MRPLVNLLATALLAGGLLGCYALGAYQPSHAPKEVAPGITVSIENLTSDANGWGRLYLARVKLDPETIDLFITPAQTASNESNFTHRLAHTQAIAKQENLAVAINASMFAGGSFPIRRAGEPARPMETTVVQGVITNLWEHTYMLGFRPDLKPDPVLHKPPPVSRMSSWKWGFGAQSWQVFDGNLIAASHDHPYKRTVVALADNRTTLLFAVFDHATFLRTAQELQSRGATDVFNLDGSESSTFALNGVPLTGDWRPVANHYGIRSKAKP